MSRGLLTAGSGQGWENELVAALDRPGAPLTVLRRCVDIADVLALAGTGQVAVAVLAADLRRLDSEAVQRLRTAGVAVLGVHGAADDRARIRLERIGVDAVAADDAGSAALVELARAAVLDASSDRTGPAELADRRGVADPRFALPPAITSQDAALADHAASRGRVVAVWGPTGAPGRSTVAAGIAVEAAAAGVPTVLVDADVYGGVLASAFGLLDESPGLAGACRLAANGRLDADALTNLCWSIGPGLRLLTGIARPDRWPEVRPSAVPMVLERARSLAPLTVVDCGFCLEADEEISFDTVAPRRNGATLAVLGDAETVLAVGSADPAGVERLVRGLAELGEILPEVRPRVVLNRVRPGASPPDENDAAVRRFTGSSVLAQLPEDRPAVDKAWRQGLSLREVAPSSPLRAGLRSLSAALTPAVAAVS